MNIQNTPHSNRIHIGIFGKVNSGKSTLLNSLTNKEVSIVSNVEGTTTDLVYKTMEIQGMGPVVFIDTAGFNDQSELGNKRLEKTKPAAKKSDIAIILFDDEDVLEGMKWVEYFKDNNTKHLIVINDKTSNDIEKIKAVLPNDALVVNALDKENINILVEELIKCTKDNEEKTITGDLVKPGDLVLLVMPQDIQAPKGRLILPQVQTIRELLDKKCIVVSCTANDIDLTLNSLSKDPNLIICDSQVFKIVYDKKPTNSKLTSFSVLFAGYKGDIKEFIKGAYKIDALTNKSKVLIVEACTHAPKEEDIGRVKIPNLLKKKVGVDLTVDFSSGVNLPDNLSSYDLIIHCGACMFNSKYVLSRILDAKKLNVPITNYGITIAYLNNILNKISI